MNQHKGWIFWGSVIALIMLPAPSQGAVKGLCSNCHTMHNSQQGSVIAFTLGSSGQQIVQAAPFNRLLKTDCVGCHSHAGSETIVNMGESRIPIVFNLIEPVYPPNGSSSSALAGGNFYWVAQGGDQFGHNIHGISEQDSRMGGAFLAPGGETGANECASCHRTLATEQTACNGCHVAFHHAIGSNEVAGAEEGWYRFLGSVMQRGENLGPTPDGVTGIEDPDWEQAPSPTRHNTYNGSTAPYNSFLDTRSINQKCAGCHGLFHSRTSADSVWIRHPVDSTIPNSGEFSDFTTYTPMVPVARQNVTAADANSSSVNKDSDVVSCISCHRPHGSPYPAMLRWAYRDWPGIDSYTGQPALNGCAVCHTSKD
jgi:hypothetical protein